MVTINMFPGRLKEPSRVARGLFPAVRLPFSLFPGNDYDDVCYNHTHFASVAFLVRNSDASIGPRESKSW